MGKWLKRLRAAVGNAVTWAVAWAVVGAGLGLFLGLGLPGVPLWVIMLRLAITTSVAGFIAGGSFAVVLGVMERNHSLADLRVSRIALWGALGGIAFPLASYLTGMISSPIPAAIVVGVTALLGAGSSAGSLMLARRAEGLELESGALDELEAGSSP